MLVLFSCYCLNSYHLDLGENILINPLNSFGLEIFNLLMYDALNVNYALLFPIGPFMKFNNLRKDNYFNSYLKLIRYSSFNHHIKDNSDIYKKILNKDLKNMIGSGYYAYKNIFSLGYLIELIDNKTLFVNKLRIYLENLDDNKTYSLLPVIRWIDHDSGVSRSITINDSIKITKLVDINILLENLYNSMIKSLYKYDVNNSNSEFVLMNRVWLELNDFNVKKNEFDTITKTVNNSLSKIKFNKEELIMKRLSSVDIDNYNHIIMDNYGIPINSSSLVNDYRLNENQYIKVKKLQNNMNLITVKNFDNSDQNLIKWSDTKKDFGFIRKKDNISYFFNHYGDIFKSEASYNFLDFPEDNRKEDQNFKFGAIDFETFGNEGIGIQNVYAAGWAINDNSKTNKFYYINKDANSLEIVKNLIFDLANNLEFNGYTFYAHNLGRFDSVFLIKACSHMEDIEIIPKWKENKILSISIKNNTNKCKFKILDSIQMLNGSLDSLCKSFKIVNQKGIFPHNFINKDRLFYIGKTPHIKHFKKMPISVYNLMKSDNWNLKDEALKYLKKDVFGLLEVMVKFNDKIYNLYSLNINNYVTSPKLAMAIYTSKFYNNDLKIKMIRGIVEKDIRSAYFGGNVNVLINKIDKGFYYDMNSQYPFAMLNDMPIGNPTLSNDTNLDNYFGFVYGEITAPDESRLRVPYIQCRDDKSDNVDCPRGSFTRMIFSEEIKEAIKDGYSMKIKYGYKFERGKNLFKDYVDTFYEIKKNTNDPVEKALSKLLLNSLYGKFGMKDIISTMKIVDHNEAKKITKDYNYTICSDLGDGKFLIKYSSKVNESLRKLVKDFEENPNSNHSRASLFRSRGVPSAVQISAAISAYARISINKFKNIPGNPCVYSDTDSVVLTNKLPDICIGKDLGQMKLEHVIEEGIFIRKKLYALKTIDNKFIYKSSGVDSSTLNYDKFKLLLAGHHVLTEALSFNVIWKDLNIDIVNRSINLQGLKSKIIDIKDHYDINFKAIVPYRPPIINNYTNLLDILYHIVKFDIRSFLKKLLTFVYNSIYKFIFFIRKIFTIPK